MRASAPSFVPTGVSNPQQSSNDQSTSTTANRTRPPAASSLTMTGRWLPKIGNGLGCSHFVFGDPNPSEKIAAFDLDGTIITTRSGKTFPQNEHDWKILHDRVIPKLRQAHRDGWSIVLISNQAGSGNLSTNFLKKLPIVCRKLHVPLQAFAALGYNEYRKGSPGIWNAFVERFNGGKEIDYEESYYVGDAAGRQQDHNDTDRKFALNCGLRFFTPEEYFLEEPIDNDWKIYGWDPSTYQPDHPIERFIESKPEQSLVVDTTDSNVVEAIIFVGSPAIGKTTYYERTFDSNRYIRIDPTVYSNDTLLLESITSLLLAGQSIVIDASNPTIQDRRFYISHLLQLKTKQAPQSQNIKIHCIHFESLDQMDLVRHNSIYRALYSKGTERQEAVEWKELTGFENRLKRPQSKEGFDSIRTVQFDFVGTEAERIRWNQRLGDSYPGKAMNQKESTSKSKSKQEQKQKQSSSSTEERIKRVKR